jgi:hypothetical protein
MWCSSAVNLTRLSRLEVSRTRWSPVNAVSRPAVRPAGTPQRFPWLRPFPPPPPQNTPQIETRLVLCSAASSVLWTHPRPSLRSPHQRGWQGYGFPFLPRPTMLRRTPMRPPCSCASNFPTCSRAGSQQGSRVAPCCVLPSDQKDGIGIPDLPISQLNGWPAGVPCQRFATNLTARNA